RGKQQVRPESNGPARTCQPRFVARSELVQQPPPLSAAPPAGPSVRTRTLSVFNRAGVPGWIFPCDNDTGGVVRCPAYSLLKTKRRCAAASNVACKQKVTKSLPQPRERQALP